MAKFQGTSLFKHSRQFTLYVSGGLLSALVDIGTMQLLLHWGVHYTAATTAGFLAALLVNYGFHSNVTFEAGGSKSAFGRYMCVVGVNYVLTLACVAAAQALAGAPMAGKIIALPLATASGFVLGKYWIFK